eukprot:Sdes_comp19745_c0_seq3m11752
MQKENQPANLNDWKIQKPELLYNTPLNFGTSCIWDSKTQCLYYCDLCEGKVYIFDPYLDDQGKLKPDPSQLPSVHQPHHNHHRQPPQAQYEFLQDSLESIADTFHIRKFEMRQNVSSVVPTTQQTLLVALMRGFVLVDPNTGNVNTLKIN